MARFVNPSPQWIDTDSTVLSGAKLNFYITGTTTRKDTFSDEALTTANANPVICNDAGIAPDIFVSEDVAYKLVIDRADNTQFDEIDPVGVAAETGAFADWSSTATYNIPDVVTGSDENYYRSITDANLNNDPTSSAANWSQVKFVTIYNANETYSATDRVVYLGVEYQSRVGSNLGNTPDSSPTQWQNTDDLVGDPAPQLGANLDTNGFNVVFDSGNGCDFSATADGTGTTTSELFDDYEEGTWTPVLSDGTNTATSTASTKGSYTKIGNVVRISCVMSTSSLTGSGTVAGTIQINGLPFTSSTTAASSSICASRATGLNITASESMGGYVEFSDDFIFLFAWDDVAGTTQMTATQWSADGSLFLAGSYVAA